ncbi:MAG: hypothetical protein AB8A40_09865 [Prochlorococcus sp.]|jgi:hypothetical protein
MKKPTQPTLHAALFELNKELSKASLKEFVKTGNIGLVRTNNPRMYSENEWNQAMDYLKENVELEIIAKVKQT